MESSLRDPAKAAEASAGSAVVVNLAGAPVAVRWTEAAKRAMTTSRVDLSRAYIDALARIENRPSAYVGGSAIGYYGYRRTDVPFDESSPPGDDFLARLCVAWEAEADRAGTLGMRVAKIRTGLVLGRDGGVLGKLLPLFRLGLGGGVIAWPLAASHNRAVLSALPVRMVRPSGLYATAWPTSRRAVRSSRR